MIPEHIKNSQKRKNSDPTANQIAFSFVSNESFEVDSESVEVVESSNLFSNIVHTCEDVNSDKCQILIVDDDMFNLEILKNLLSIKYAVQSR